MGGLRPGQQVAALTIVGGGGYGEVTVTRAELVVPLDELPLSGAAAAPSNTTTAFLVLEEVARPTRHRAGAGARRVGRRASTSG